MSQAVTKELPHTGLSPSRYPDNVRGQPVPNGQPALPYTGAPSSLYPDNIRGQAVPQADPATPYEGTPPYTENPRYPAALSSPSSPPYTFGPDSTPAPPSYTASADPPSSSRLLHVYHPRMRHQNTQILGPDKTTVLYTMKMNFGFLSVPKPHVTIYRADTGIVVGSFNFRSMSRRIEMTIHDKPVDLSRSGWCTSAHEGTNLATTAEGGAVRFRWTMDGFFKGANMTCLDQQNKVYARFESSMWALRKDGKFEVGPFMSGVLMDEVVIIGLAILEKRRRQNNDAAIGAGGSAAANSGGGC